jgi:hypothetical protein
VSRPAPIGDVVSALAAHLSSMARASGDDATAAELERLAADAVRAEPASAALPDDRLWTQMEACTFLGVSPRYLRESACPKILLPGTGPKGQSIVRYAPADVKAWAEYWRAARHVRSVRQNERAKERGRVA